MWVYRQVWWIMAIMGLSRLSLTFQQTSTGFPLFGSPPLQKLSHPQVLLNCSTRRKGGVFFHVLFAKSSTLNAEKIIIENYGAKHYRFTSDNSWRGRTDGPNVYKTYLWQSDLFLVNFIGLHGLPSSKLTQLLEKHNFFQVNTIMIRCFSIQRHAVDIHTIHEMSCYCLVLGGLSWDGWVLSWMSLLWPIGSMYSVYGIFTYMKPRKVNHSWIGRYTNHTWVRHGYSFLLSTSYIVLDLVQLRRPHEPTWAIKWCFFVREMGPRLFQGNLVSKWLVTPIYKPFGRGPTTRSLGDLLTVVII